MRGLKTGILFGTWEFTLNKGKYNTDGLLKRVLTCLKDIEGLLKPVSAAHYQSGACCLKGTRRKMIEHIATWVDSSIMSTKEEPVAKERMDTEGEGEISITWSASPFSFSFCAPHQTSTPSLFFFFLTCPKAF